MKILVIKRDKIGDLLLTTPMLAVLKAALPQAEVHLLANDYNAWVVADDPNVDRRWIYRRARVGRSVRPGAALHAAWQVLVMRLRGYDWAIVANGSESPRAIRRGLQSGAKRVVACVEDASRWPQLTHGLSVAAGVHEVDRMIGLLAPLGVAAPVPAPLPVYRLPETSRAAAAGWLEARGLAPRGYVVLGLGARRAKKQPSTEQILRWSRHWLDTHGLQTVFMWTPGRSDNPLYPGDDEVAEPVLAARERHIHPFRGPIPPALGLIWGASTSVFPDSGLMHFAAASPGGVLGLFAETHVSPHPSQWGPRGSNVDFLDAPTSVAALSDEQVLGRVARLLGA
jgi:ADP-heptose:LPS heptosyltransferase